MTTTNLAPRPAEPLTEDSQARALRLVSSRDDREEMRRDWERQHEENMRRWRHENVARKMSRCGKRPAAVLPFPAPVETSSGWWIPTLAMLGAVFALAWYFADAPAPQLEDAIGSARLRYNRRASAHLIVPVSVNGVIGRFILDTGAPNTMISAAFAARANVKTLPHIAFEMTTWATFHVNSGEADTIALGDARVAHMYVSVYTSDNDWPDRNADGLLGLSFLEHFHMQLDRGVLELTPLGVKPPLTTPK
jgi:gag-polyprotein putative aspartyl protease